MPSGAQKLPDPAVRRVDRGQRDAGDRGRQRERQIDEGVEQLPAGEAVAHQHPGDDQAEDGVDRGGEERGAEADSRSAASVRGSVAIAQNAGQPERRGPQDQGRRAGSARSG